MIQPKPYQLKCQNCNHIKIVQPKSDALNICEISSLCPKCNIEMKREELSPLNRVLLFLKNMYLLQ